MSADLDQAYGIRPHTEDELRAALLQLGAQRDELLRDNGRLAQLAEDHTTFGWVILMVGFVAGILAAVLVKVAL